MIIRTGPGQATHLPTQPIKTVDNETLTCGTVAIHSHGGFTISRSTLNGMDELRELAAEILTVLTHAESTHPDGRQRAASGTPTPKEP